ncbi:Protein SMALL AUXIN UP-REGULATED RNA 16 [Linum grandiflorum]
MAPSTCKNNKGSGGIINLKIVAKKLQKSLNSLGIKKANNVPGDVKEGHFAVLAVEGVEEPQRFVVPLSYLTHPTFLRLLEQAAEEYGFEGREGALAVPCRPSELEMILSEQWEESELSTGRMMNNGGGGGGRDSWGSSSCKTMVSSF